jgi:Large polyvalent protein associated domain 29
MTTEIRYTTTETAKLIRAELKAAFPSVKFSVRKEHYGVLNISFDGSKEIKNDVQAIADKYECGSFDGMTDSHNYSSKRVGDLLIDYSTRFIFVNCHEKAVA